MTTKTKIKKPIATETRLVDYKPPVFLVRDVYLDFDIRDDKTTVTNRMVVYRNKASKDKKAPLALNGENQKLISVSLNGQVLPPRAYQLQDDILTIPAVTDGAEIEIVSTHNPAANTALLGLYAAGPMLCTQCESEGFRRITFYPDRPDVLARFYVTIHADKKKYPYLLANGNRIEEGRETGGRHYAKWEDPFPKPCYLFALVAGKLDRVVDSFRTKSGRDVRIEIYVEPGRKKETGFAREAIKKSMAWDEETYGLEYDLDLFMIVAVSFFNFGAMENKGLNIFNESCVLGRADTVTDPAIAYIERVVGHEYFHNYTGDRVTCRDWFQLSLKEGLTVFREQEFCGDMNAPALERLGSVAKLRAFQFPEDAGGMAHPIRPHSYQAIENFYTSTVYSKGSEVVRMIQTIIGKDAFRRGLNLYLTRHDGCAATCEDFVAAMAEAGKVDLKQFMLWYAQAGTPVLAVKTAYDPKAKTYTIRVKQSVPPTPGQPKKKPMHIPFAVGLLDSKGKDMIGTRVFELRKANEEIVIKNVREAPVPSFLRGFSAPVRLEYAYTDDELLFLMAHDSDPFCRWEAGQKLLAQSVLAVYDIHKGGEVEIDGALIEALRAILEDDAIDAATKAMMLCLPLESDLGLMLRAKGKQIDPIALHEAREAVILALATMLEDILWDTAEAIESKLSETASDGRARGMRRLKNLCLGFLGKLAGDEVPGIAAEMVALSRNMTDKIAALAVLVDQDGMLKKPLLQFFEETYRDQPMVMDSWFAVQAGADSDTVLRDVKRLMKHPCFSLKNPNRISALIGSFLQNPRGFHAADGAGYDFIVDLVVKLDKINRVVAPRYVKPFLRMRDFDAKRQKLMKAALKKLAAQKTLSPNTREIVLKSMAG